VTDAAPETALPKRTTPTWDMELLVSAASVFTLVQVPGWLDTAYDALRPRLDVDWDLFARLLYSYGKLAVMLLAGAFALHLAMRAYWIALVGMHSIYPEGTHFDALRVGPLRKRFLREHSPSMPERIERADNRASIVFAVGLAMAVIQLAVLVFVLVAHGLAAGLVHGLGWTWLGRYGFFGLAFLLVAPLMLAAIADRHGGDRIAPGGRIARAIEATYHAYARLGFGVGVNAILELMQSRIGARRMMAWSLAAIGVCGLLAVSQIVVQQGDMPFGDYARWPRPRPGLADSVQPGHYRDQSPDTLSTLPTIDGAFPAGDYLTLVVPFDPKRAPASLAKACAAPWREADSPARRAKLLDCLGRWLAVRIDGQPVPARFRYTTDPRNGQLGALAVLPIAALPAGEHQLALRYSPSMHRPEKDPPADYLIVFWR
jgi:hypothetical protein